MIYRWIVIIFLFIISPIYQASDPFIQNYYQVNWLGKISGDGSSILYDQNKNGVVDEWPIVLFGLIFAIFFICSFIAGVYWNEYSKGEVTVRYLEISFYLQLASSIGIILLSLYVSNLEAEYKPTLLGTLIWLVCVFELYMIYGVKEYWKIANQKEDEKTKEL